MTPPVEKILVDTDVFSYLMSGKTYANLYRRHVDGKQMAISFVTVGELYFGAYKKKWGEERLEALKDRLRKATIVPYDDAVCRTYADIKVSMQGNGMVVSDNDLWIAACAVRHGIPLLSNNARHFAGIPGLVLKTESKAMQEMQAQMSIPAAATSSSSEPPQPSAQSTSASKATKNPPR